MTPVCTEITEWISENVSKPIEDWENKTEQKCKKRHWYDPRSWFCWLVTILVKVIRWIVVTVVTAVITVTCKLISTIIDILLDVLKFLGLLIKALVTWDKCTLQEALAQLGNGIIDALLSVGYIIVDPIVDWVQDYRLRGYVRDQIEAKYKNQSDVIQTLKDAFHVETGVFGYRVTCKVHRFFVDSQTKSQTDPNVPNLFSLHNAKQIDLYELAGFHTDPQDCAIFEKAGWYRPRPQTAIYPFAAGGGFGEPTPPRLACEGLDEYISSAGTKGPHFRIYAMSKEDMQTRFNAAEEKGRQIGLILNFSAEDHEVTESQYMYFSPNANNNYLISKSGFGRFDENVSPSGAKTDLCSPAASAVFRFRNRQLRGVTDNLFGTVGYPHDLDDSNTSGVSFIDDIPDTVRKYVLIHELGHYFSLTHVDGFDRMMVSGAQGQGDFLTPGAPFKFLFFGGPRFIYTERKRVWDFILANFEQCFVPTPPLPVPPVEPPEQPPVIL